MKEHQFSKQNLHIVKMSMKDIMSQVFDPFSNSQTNHFLLTFAWFLAIYVYILVHWFLSCTQRSKLTFSKSRLLATFNCKMVAIKKIQLPKTKTKTKTKRKGEDTSWHITRLMRWMARFQHFTLQQKVYVFMLSFWTTRGERERQVMLPACTID